MIRSGSGYKDAAAGARCSGAAYFGEPKTPGFTSVRQPGMGVDEGCMIVYNEMQRIPAYANAKANK